MHLCDSRLLRWSRCCAFSSCASCLVRGRRPWESSLSRCSPGQMVASAPSVYAQRWCGFGWPSECRSQERGNRHTSDLSSSRALPRARMSPRGSKPHAQRWLPGPALSTPLRCWTLSNALTPFHTTGSCGRPSLRGTTSVCYGFRSLSTACFARCALVFAIQRRWLPPAASPPARSWQLLKCVSSSSSSLITPPPSALSHTLPCTSMT